MNNLLDRGANDNPADDPRWFVLHGGVGSLRRRWGPDMQRIADDLVRYGWIIKREGADLVAKHSSRMEGNA
jgi:hypothetical protein